MTSVEMQHERDGPIAQPARRTAAWRQTLLIAGIVSSLLYVAVDLLSAWLYPGYSLVDQAISELSAIGAPTKHLWTAMGPVYDVLVIAFGIGVARAAGRNRALRVAGALLVGLGVSGVLWFFVPMHQRGAEMTWTDVGHVVLGGATMILILAFIGFGTVALGRRFRVYSWVTALTFIAGGAGTFAMAGRLAAGEPTPWLGIVERIEIYAYLLWIAVLAVALLRRGEPSASRRRAPSARAVL